MSTAPPADTFEHATAVVEGARGSARVHFSATVPDGWQQGAGAFGGVVLGALARAMDAAQGDVSRRLRALQGEVLAPVQPGEVDVEVELLRVGKGMSFVDARMRAGGDVVARASAAFGAARPMPVSVSAPPPEAVDPTTVAVFDAAPPFAPAFTAHYEYRLLPPLPLTQGPDAVANGFIRARVPPLRMDAPHLIGLVDAWLPALFAKLDAPRPTSTVSFLAELVVDPTTLDPRAPLRHRAEVRAAAEGYCVELRELWAGDVLVALNQQVFAVIR
ncbi:MAG: thioesterase family protein [Deltaproteobacteria bacterium]|nr:thioesterase family protein [Deltaproteobacteria bacterium]